MYRNRKGSALMLVIISALFLIILTGAAYTYMRSSGRTHTWNRDRIQVKLTAESGANLAVHMIMGGADIPQGTEPQWFLGSSATWYDLPAPLGRVKVVVDPFDSNAGVLTANAYEVRSIGIINSAEGPVTFTMATGVMPENIARFAVFMDKPSTAGYYGDGYKFDGPFYANGPVWIYSTSAGYDNDPYFHSLTLTSNHYLAQSGKVMATTPEVLGGGGNLRLQPYNRMLLGPPYFELGAEPIPFGSTELDWTSVSNAAASGGLTLEGVNIQNGMRMMIRNDTLMVKLNEFAPVQKYWLGSLTKNVVWIDNAPGDEVYLRSFGTMRTDGLSIPLTIGMRGSLVVSGSILYENNDIMDPNNEIILGLLSVNGNVYMSRCNQDTTTTPHPFPGNWADGFSIETTLDVEVDGVVLCLDGVLEAKNYQLPDPGVVWLIMGGYMIQEEGYTGMTTFSGPVGYDMQVHFDSRLMTMHPPFFPNNGRWHVLYWKEDPTITEGLIGENAI